MEGRRSPSGRITLRPPGGLIILMLRRNLSEEVRGAF
jgi:hypothetical protein